MKLNIKNLFMFGAIYSSLYIFLLSFLRVANTITNKANFNFLNISADMRIIEQLYGGVNSYVYDVFGATVNLTFILYIISYITLPFYVIINFFANIIFLITYEIAVIQYPITILPFGIGAMLSGLFYLILILVVITGIKIVSSGLGD